SAREVRRAYLDRARQLHPDTARDADERQMQAVNEAWFVLRDPARRARYDRELDGDGRSTPPPTEHDYEPEPEWVMEPEPAMEPGRASDPVMLLPAALVLGGIGLLVFSTMTMSGPL